MVYRKQNGAFTLESAGFSGGRFVAEETDNGTVFSPHYYLTDHLGSVRGVVDAAGEVIEHNDYYPFGMRWSDSASQFSDNRYRYNSKEEQHFLEVPYIDYGARMYDPRFGMRWNGINPLSEKYYPIGTYTFCLNNPVKFLDPNGKEVDISEMTNEHLNALLLMLSTPEGLEFIGRYMAKGSSLQVGGKTFRFNNEGNRSKDKLWIRSLYLEGRKGHNDVYTRSGYQRLDNNKFSIYNKDSNIIDGVHQRA